MQNMYFRKEAVTYDVLQESKKCGHFVTSRNTPYWLGYNGKIVLVRMSKPDGRVVGKARICPGPNTRATLLGGTVAGAHIDLEWL
jgi:hypothetical protein